MSESFSESSSSGSSKGSLTSSSSLEEEVGSSVEVVDDDIMEEESVRNLTFEDEDRSVRGNRVFNETKESSKNEMGDYKQFRSIHKSGRTSDQDVISLYEKGGKTPIKNSILPQITRRVNSPLFMAKASNYQRPGSNVYIPSPKSKSKPPVNFEFDSKGLEDIPEEIGAVGNVGVKEKEKENEIAEQEEEELSENEEKNLRKVGENYRIGKLLGKGANGTVYIGMDQVDGFFFALKEINFEEISPENLDVKLGSVQEEISLMKKLHHKNIVRYLGARKREAKLHIFLEYIPGGSLQNVIKTYGRLSESVAKCYTMQVLKGLEYLHSNNVIHRDIKTANILVDIDSTVRLADFGCSKKIEKLRGNYKSIQGTPAYMAPEVIKQTGHGKPADVWSVGCTVLEMLTGEPPFFEYNSSTAVMYHIASTSQPPKYPSFISRESIAFLDVCFVRNPQDRPSASELLRHRWIKDVNDDDDGQEKEEVDSPLVSYSSPEPEFSPHAPQRTTSPRGLRKAKKIGKSNASIFNPIFDPETQLSGEKKKGDQSKNEEGELPEQLKRTDMSVEKLEKFKRTDISYSVPKPGFDSRRSISEMLFDRIESGDELKGFSSAQSKRLGRIHKTKFRKSLKKLKHPLIKKEKSKRKTPRKKGSLRIEVSDYPLSIKGISETPKRIPFKKLLTPKIIKKDFVSKVEKARSPKHAQEVVDKYVRKEKKMKNRQKKDREKFLKDTISEMESNYKETKKVASPSHKSSFKKRSSSLPPKSSFQKSITPRKMSKKYHLYRFSPRTHTRTRKISPRLYQTGGTPRSYQAGGTRKKSPRTEISPRLTRLNYQTGSRKKSPRTEVSPRTKISPRPRPGLKKISPRIPDGVISVKPFTRRVSPRRLEKSSRKLGLMKLKKTL